MRAPQDAARAKRRRRLSKRGRILLVAVLVALTVLFFSLRGIARVYTDYLWFESLGFGSVWSGLIASRLLLGLLFTVGFFVLLWVNLWVADRVAPRFRPSGPEEELLERYFEVVGRRSGLVRGAVCLVFALIAGAGVAQQWNDWILFTNRVDFEQKDPLFGLDIGFYVFQLPFLSFLVSWLFAAFVIILIVTTVAHYLNGGIRVQTPGQRVTPQVKAHLSVLLAVLALVKAAGYLLQRFELTVSDKAFVTGAGYTAVKAQLPAIMLLLFISVFSCGLFLYNIRRRGWVLPVLAVGLWAFVALVAGSAYPWFVQRFRVEPAESTREAAYIQRNIAATREAYGLAGVEVRDFSATGELDAASLMEDEGASETLSNLRLLDPEIVDDSFQRSEADFGWLRFPTELDVDRYSVDGKETSVLIGARELDGDSLPLSQRGSWEAEKLIYTHGYGVAVAPTAELTPTGEPSYRVGGVPPTVDAGMSVGLEQPRLYFSENLSGYAIVDTNRDEVAFPDDAFRYDGEGGVGIGSYLRRAAFALRFQDVNPLISSYITGDSKILFERGVRDRLEKVAPFLKFDSDPYPVIHDGRIVYMVDAYTTSNRYPYAERFPGLGGTAGLGGEFNYVRNSVKAVVDAYDGHVTLYLTPEAGDGGRVDPIAQAYAKAFPELFESYEDMPDELKAHQRHPTDLFRVQTTLYGRYYIDEPGAFYEGSQRWVVSQRTPREINAATTGTRPATLPGQPVEPLVEERIRPQYLEMALPGEDEADFLNVRSFVPISEDDQKRELTAFMAARPDGSLVVYRTTGSDVEGPSFVSSIVMSSPEVSLEISLLNQQGSRVELGNMLAVPVDDALLWVMPIYVSAAGSTSFPQVKQVVAVHKQHVEMAPTVDQALRQILGVEEGEPPGTSPEGEPPPTTTPGGPTTTPPPPGATTTVPPTGPDEVGDLAARAQELFVEADRALRAGDLAGYQAKVREAQDLVGRIATALAPGNQPGSA
ncbi:MAG: hypothetical protein GEV08_07690 [Acidimicrobiia bacterium]|nr:hypothetical protein [Acidimicrobiia bacterium]